MTQLRKPIGFVRLVAVTIGMSACVPRFVSLPSNLRADAQQSEYRTSAFPVRAPHGRWATDAVMSLRKLTVRWTCDGSYDSIVLAGLVEAYTDVGGNRTPLHVEQIRFYRIVKMQIVSDDPALLSDADACITIRSYALIRHDSSAAAPKSLLGFFQTVQQGVRKLASSICLWSDFWGGHASAGVGRFQELRVGERTFYYVALVSETDSTKFCEDHGVELLYAAQGKVFAVFASSPGILDDALPVAESLTPRE